MNESVESQLRVLLKGWDEMTIEQFRRSAQRELNGSAFESVRVEGGRRCFLIICATGKHEISMIEQTFELANDPVSAKSWESQTLFDLAYDTERGLGLSYQDQRSPDGRRSAVILCATRPETIRMLEVAFNLPG